jgi:hypothetical protein
MAFSLLAIEDTLRDYTRKFVQDNNTPHPSKINGV